MVIDIHADFYLEPNNISIKKDNGKNKKQIQKNRQRKSRRQSRLSYKVTEQKIKIRLCNRYKKLKLFGVESN